MATSTPWGKADHTEHVAKGITWYSTPSHGGFKLSPQMNAMVPDYMRCGRDTERGWYEEDCAWSIVATVFPQYFCEDERRMAKDSLGYWQPTMYERWYKEPAPRSRQRATIN